MAIVYLYFSVTTLLFGENKEKATITTTKCKKKKNPSKPQKQKSPPKKSNQNKQQTLPKKQNTHPIYQKETPNMQTNQVLPQKVAQVIPRAQDITNLGFNIALKPQLSNYLQVIT